MKKTTIWHFIKANDDLLAGKLLELHELVTEWLSYIPATFPHYTRHTVAHSEQIIDQVSKLLFLDGNADKPVIESLSVMEAYIICVSAFLHDSGMVVSEEEKRRVIQSDEWNEWIVTESAVGHWTSIQAMRKEAESSRDAHLHFNADILTRHLIAEFIRRQHHSRAAKLVLSAQRELGRFAFDDPILLRTIADVCEAHGLPLSQLEDQSRFPDRRTIRNYDVNVRFVAAVLRLGDLLDMSSDRACPLIMNAACPLPLESIAHWTQYQRINHRLTAPDLIEITAECESQDEHRFLYDWCNWLVEELRVTGPLASKWRRHAAWQIPTATIEGSNPTIVVKPSSSAHYIPSDWSIQLDKSAVLNLLAGQLYESDLAFVRELVQNAVDATRCKLSADVISRGEELPEFLVDVDSRQREALQIEVRLADEMVTTEFFDESTPKQTIVVKDVGVGMTRSVIERFFLQVGRSYYRTEEFKQTFKFNPTSRFGVGFLSCFGVSDHVQVETKPYNSSEDALRLILTGPASYVLTEKSTKQDSGTEITVRLQQAVPLSTVEELLNDWFPALEFPIRLSCGAHVRTIRPVTTIEAMEEVVDLSEEGACFFVRSIPFRRDGIIGTLFVFVHKSSIGERWDRYSWTHNAYREKFPGASPPVLPKSITSFHGVAVGARDYGNSGSFSERIDIRGAQFEIAASRSHFYHRNEVVGYQKVVNNVWDELLEAHLKDRVLAGMGGDWKYVNRLFLRRGSLKFWASQKCVPMIIDGHERLVSLEALDEMADLGILGIPESGYAPQKEKIIGERLNLSIPYIEASLQAGLADDLKKHLLKGRSIHRVEKLPDGQLLSVWSLSRTAEVIHGHYSKQLIACEFIDSDLIGANLASMLDWQVSVNALNQSHPIFEFILAVKTSAEESGSVISQWHVDHMFDILINCIQYSNRIQDFKTFGIRLIELDSSLAGFGSALQSVDDSGFANSFS